MGLCIHCGRTSRCTHLAASSKVAGTISFGMRTTATYTSAPSAQGTPAGPLRNRLPAPFFEIFESAATGQYIDLSANVLAGDRG